MKHAKVLGIKFIVISIAVLSLFGIFDHAPFGNMLLMSIILTAVSYVVGDLFVLRRFGNLAASIADFALIFATLWLLSAALIGTNYQILLPSFFSAYFISFSEPFIHAYLLNDEEIKLHEPTKTARLQTEFADEMDAQDFDMNQKGK